MAGVAKKSSEEKRSLSFPNPKPGKTLETSTMDLVSKFYNCDEISREMPGMKDKVRCKLNVSKITAQKRLILCTLKEPYQAFKKDFSDCKVGFLKFCSFRPKHVVLPGSSGTHNVCVCTIHQNVKLMIEGAKFSADPNFFPTQASPKLTYKEFLNALTCQPPTTECQMNT